MEAFRETLTRANPDVLLLVGCDHFHQLWLDNMPQFLVGQAPVYDANWYNEEREFGLPRMHMRGDRGPLGHLLRGGLDAGFDLAFSNELRHRPQRHVPDHHAPAARTTCPIVPVYTNIFAPPLPLPKRFVELGSAIRELVEAWPSDKRVAIIGTGHLSLELGGPRQFGPHGPDPEFDAKAVEWIASGDLEGCLVRGDARQPARARQRHPRLHGLHAHDGRRRREREGRLRRHLDLFHTMEAYFTWYPTSGARRLSSEQVPAGQVPLHRRPRPRPRRALPRGPGRHRRLVGGRARQPPPRLHAGEASTWLGFEDAEREALATHDYLALFDLGAHPFLTLTLFIAMFERDHAEPLGFQLEYARRLADRRLPYPDIAT